MQDKRKRILTMLENGSISMDEALTLLENLSAENQGEQQEQPAATEKEVSKQPEEEKVTGQDSNDLPVQSTFEQTDKNTGSKEKEQPSVDDFLDDLRRDFSHVGERFMHFMQTAVQKVKEFDLDSPFGKSVHFNHTITKSAKGIEELIIYIDNGKVTVHPSDEEELRAEFNVKAYNNDSEESAKNDFLEKVLVVIDDNKLRVASDLKMMQVNVDLYVPNNEYKKLSVRLLNGSFKMKNASYETIRVKTTNGKIEASNLTFTNAEFETANGTIRLNEMTGDMLEAETLNGRVYIDGELKEVDAQSLNGHVIVTTTSEEAEKVEAKTMSGSVELYLPSNISLSGEIVSNIGKLDLQLEDIDRTSEQDQLLQRSVRFTKDVEESKGKLYVHGEAKTGTVLVQYNP